MRRLLLAVALLLAASPAFAQITVPERAAEHTVVALKIDRTLPAGSKAKYRWSAPTLSIGEGTEDNKTAYVTGKPGAHSIDAVIAWLDGDSLQLEKHSATLTIGDGPAPTPDKTLAELAGPHAAILAELLTDIREAALPIAPSVQSIKNALNAGLKRANIATDHPAAVEIAKRIDAAGSGGIDDAIRKSLDAALAKAIADLGTKPPVPPTPPVVEGKRRVVLLHETDDQSTAFGALMVSLANNSPSAKYLADKGHVLQILEEEQQDQSGNPHPLVEKLKALGHGVPSLYILDLATGQVLHSQKLPADATGDNVVEITRQHGG